MPRRAGGRSGFSSRCSSRSGPAFRSFHTHRSVCIPISWRCSPGARIPRRDTSTRRSRGSSRRPGFPFSRSPTGRFICSRWSTRRSRSSRSISLRVATSTATSGSWFCCCSCSRRSTSFTASDSRPTRSCSRPGRSRPIASCARSKPVRSPGRRRPAARRRSRCWENTIRSCWWSPSWSRRSFIPGAGSICDRRRRGWRRWSGSSFWRRTCTGS